MRICCMSQETQTGALYQPRGVAWGERWEGGSKGRGYMYTYGWFMSRFDRKQQNSVKQLSFNKKKFFLKKNFGGENRQRGDGRTFSLCLMKHNNDPLILIESEKHTSWGLSPRWFPCRVNIQVYLQAATTGESLLMTIFQGLEFYLVYKVYDVKYWTK